MDGLKLVPFKAKGAPWSCSGIRNTGVSPLRLASRASGRDDSVCDDGSHIADAVINFLWGELDPVVRGRVLQRCARSALPAR